MLGDGRWPGLTSERLFDFVRRWQERTGESAALCDRELSGEHPVNDAGAMQADTRLRKGDRNSAQPRISPCRAQWWRTP